MNSTNTSSEDLMLPEISRFTELLQQGDVHAALEYLNHRTPHRYTGIFRFNGDTLHNEALFDRKLPATRQGAAAPLAATYCSLVGRRGAPVQILNAPEDPQTQGIATAVVSYCGVLIRNSQGQLRYAALPRAHHRPTLAGGGGAATLSSLAAAGLAPVLSPKKDGAVPRC